MFTLELPCDIVSTLSMEAVIFVVNEVFSFEETGGSKTSETTVLAKLAAALFDACAK